MQLDQKIFQKINSVEIDPFDQLTLTYRSSWIFPIELPYLAVYSLSVLLKVLPSNNRSISECCPSCIHGQCYDYINDRNSRFCRCESGWTDVQCDVQYICNCATGSMCVSDSIWSSMSFD